MTDLAKALAIRDENRIASETRAWRCPTCGLRVEVAAAAVEVRHPCPERRRMITMRPET